jgi:hypothetical protein
MSGNYDRIFPTRRLLRLKVRHTWTTLAGWTGFRGKTPWDILQLIGSLGTFSALIVGVVTLNFAQEATERQAALQQQLEDDRARQATLQIYLQDMAELLLHRNLATPEISSLVRQIARANTLSTVRQLDSAREGILLRFLYDSNLIVNRGEGESVVPIHPTIILLEGADLSGANLNDAILSHANVYTTSSTLRDERG